MLNKKLFTKIILCILILNFFVFPVAISYSQDENVQVINDEIEQKRNTIKQLEEQIAEYQKSINYQKKQSFSLGNQVAILNNEINKLKTEIQLKENQIEEAELEIEETENKIATAEENIKTNKKRLTNFIQQMNKMDKKTSIELALTLDSFSDYYNHLHSLEILQDNTSQSLASIKEFKANLETHIANLEKKKKSLENLIAELDETQNGLLSRSYAKQSLLSESRNSEAKFQSLVAQLKAEQNSVNANIISLEKQIREKLSGKSDFQALGGSDFMWPVPNRGITAYFHDPTYPFRYIFEHPAIDIKSAQGSPIKAAASGYVAKAIINGTSYGYIMIVHGDGFSTVYGHTSKSFVNEEQFVSQGETIGLSGGMPGTPGSGRLSTGPHLHFEIRKNGIPVNPLNYLP
ncbi:peptidoglycan DD-metalloendopeptidase family protein [Patescibacteria group bacterium]|nr:peptidoglycan DD-metalloendopeptidase family protein [Patescibacteria group bacterium]MBU4482039.1 peptidoglycan DD-metalloendopeptidase family protein [Patescibacteria group bacterium]